MSIITLEDYNNDSDCPELIDAFNATPISQSSFDDHLDAESYAYLLAYGNTL
jgi:hypothetical protein